MLRLFPDWHHASKFTKLLYLLAHRRPPLKVDERVCAVRKLSALVNNADLVQNNRCCLVEANFSEEFFTFLFRTLHKDEIKTVYERSSGILSFGIESFKLAFVKPLDGLMPSFGVAVWVPLRRRAVTFFHCLSLDNKSHFTEPLLWGVISCGEVTLWNRLIWRMKCRECILQMRLFLKNNCIVFCLMKNRALTIWIGRWVYGWIDRSLWTYIHLHRESISMTV